MTRVADPWHANNGLVLMMCAANKIVATTVQAKRNHITKVDRRVDPRQRPYFWIEEAQDDWAPHDRSDRQAVKDGYVSVTPLQPDLTDHKSLEIVERLTQGVTTGVR